MSATKDALVLEFRRDSILRAAREVVARRGIAGASMQAIADHASVAKGTLYLYFDDRTDLLEQATDRVFDELVARTRAELRPGRPLAEALRGLVRTTFEFFDRHRELLRVPLETQASERSACGRRRRLRRARYLELVQTFLADALRRGETRGFEPAAVALFLADGMGAVVRQQLAERGRDAAEDHEWIVELLLRGLGRGRRS